MLTKGGLIVQKQEMTRIWVEDKMVPVTLLKLVEQEVVRYKTVEKDGYSAVVIGIGKKELKKEKGQKIAYTELNEFSVDESFMETHPVGSALTFSLLGDNATAVRVRSYSKGKGFQGVMRRHNFAGGPATHGSKFHRAGGSTGNRKPRRTHKGHPMAGRMGGEIITLRSVPVVDMLTQNGDTFIVLKGSIPGAYNSMVHILPK